MAFSLEVILSLVVDSLPRASRVHQQVLVQGEDALLFLIPIEVDGEIGQWHGHIKMKLKRNQQIKSINMDIIKINLRQ